MGTRTTTSEKTSQHPSAEEIAERIDAWCSPGGRMAEAMLKVVSVLVSLSVRDLRHKTVLYAAGGLATDFADIFDADVTPSLAIEAGDTMRAIETLLAQVRDDELASAIGDAIIAAALHRENGTLVYVATLARACELAGYPEQLHECGEWWSDPESGAHLAPHLRRAA